ncbi:hypothetical protein Tsubulata_011253 [Turnera subulata]|uniref:glucan endo-1,3-beta-D-glucosidase n=1 Tax=Turnera subulata TaxID=218843 RepID=A0A9Q0FYC1_9ROSI|nr:hypothetical protein Tsubulata_011253 [Turnera subulata]
MSDQTGLAGSIDAGPQQLSWVKTNVEAYLPTPNNTYITVGNEVPIFKDTSLTSNFLPVMESLHSALVAFALDNQVYVIIAHFFAVLKTSYLPYAGVFCRDLAGCVSATLNFHSKAVSPFLINAYPYFALLRLPLPPLLLRPPLQRDRLRRLHPTPVALIHAAYKPTKDTFASRNFNVFIAPKTSTPGENAVEWNLRWKKQS